MPTTKEFFDTGMAIRRDMFGPQGAENAVTGAPPFKQHFEEMITRYCFGEVWGGEHLDRKTRSLVTIAIASALGRATAVRTHVRGAIANGATVDELREVLMHTMLYAGIPAAVESFNQTVDVLKELGLE